eukprot:8831548-Pyramimonas_sp.AAC.2
MDEIVALKTLMHNKRHNIVVGGDAVSNAHMVEWSEEVDWRGLGDELASKVKFACANVVSQGAAQDAIRPIKMRPGGGADASAESAFDEATMDEVRAALPGCAGHIYPPILQYILVRGGRARPERPSPARRPWAANGREGRPERASRGGQGGPESAPDLASKRAPRWPEGPPPPGFP